MTSRDDLVDSGRHPVSTGLPGGFATTRPWILYVGIAMAVIWDVIAFVRLFHVTFPGASVSFWWPWAWLFLATLMMGWWRRSDHATPWWAWALLGIGVLSVAGATQGTALSIWAALALAVWPRQGHPWWSALAGLAVLHGVIQWGLLMTVWHLPTAINLDLLWVTGLGMLVSARGSNWLQRGADSSRLGLVKK